MRAVRNLLPVLLFIMGGGKAQAEIFDLPHLSNDFERGQMKQAANQSSAELVSRFHHCQVCQEYLVVTEQALPTSVSESQRIYPDHSKVNETEIRTQITERKGLRLQPKGVGHVRMNVELIRSGEHLVPYMAFGRWDNLKTGYFTAQWVPERTGFAVAGLAVRSHADPQTGRIVFQINTGIGKIWNRDRFRFSSSRIFEGQATVSYHFTQ